MEQARTSRVIKQYARLFESQVSSDSNENFSEAVKKLKKIILNDEAGWHFLTQGGWAPAVQERVINRLLDTIDTGRFVRSLLKVLVRHRRLALLMPILLYFEDSLLLAGRELVFFKTAQKINPEMMTQIESALSAFFSKGVLINHMIDPSLLGGGILSWEDCMIDGSLHTSLNTLLR